MAGRKSAAVMQQLEQIKHYKVMLEEFAYTEEEIASSSFYVWDESAYNENGQGWTLFTPEPLPESESEPEG